MSVIQLDNLYDNIQSKNKTLNCMDARIKSIMKQIKSANRKGKRKLVTEYWTAQIYSILQESKFECEIVSVSDGYYQYEISW